MSEYNYNIAQKRMMKLTFYLINNPGTMLPRTNRSAMAIEHELKRQYPHNIPKEIIHDILLKSNISTSKVRTQISLLGKLLNIWGSQNQKNFDEISQYYENLKIFVDFQRDLPMERKPNYINI